MFVYRDSVVVDVGPRGFRRQIDPDDTMQDQPLKKEVVNGITTCKTASACWSDSNVWTWGSNGGQLVYSKTSSPIQVLPRKASIIPHPICAISTLKDASPPANRTLEERFRPAKVQGMSMSKLYTGKKRLV
ncbi:hypothetical protein JVU11DRAFT_9141 [Chiua virens]|nr:hypothetical protein JVU11DRAFT_9141 [Chiua virens]